MIFNCFDADSLKSMTRKASTKQFNVVYYKVTNSTRLVHCKTKGCLVSIHTKSELIEY